MKQPKPLGATIFDVSGLIPKHIYHRSQLEDLEFANINDAQSKYLLGSLTATKAPFDLTWTLKVHQEMFGKVWTWAGKIRQSSLNLGIEPAEIQNALYQLLQNLKFWDQKDSMPILERATRLHHGLVYIHPFMNGNGRWARLLTNIYLRKNHQALIYWPEKTLKEQSPQRQEYLAALKLADQGDFKPLLTWQDARKK